MELNQYLGKLEYEQAIDWRENSLEVCKNSWVNINQKTINNWRVIDKALNKSNSFLFG